MGLVIVIAPRPPRSTPRSTPVTAPPGCPPGRGGTGSGGGGTGRWGFRVAVPNVGGPGGPTVDVFIPANNLITYNFELYYGISNLSKHIAKFKEGPPPYLDRPGFKGGGREYFPNSNAVIFYVNFDGSPHQDVSPPPARACTGGVRVVTDKYTVTWGDSLRSPSIALGNQV